MDLHRYEGHLNPRPPYDFEHSKRFIRQAYPGDTLTAADHTLTFPLLAEDQCLIVSLRSRGKVESPLLMMTVLSPATLTEAQFAAIQQRVGDFLSLNDEVQPLYSCGWDDEPFAGILDDWYGYHQVKFATPFAATCYAQFIQAAAGTAAKRMWQAVLRAHGPTQTYAGETLAAFPGAETISALELEDLSHLLDNEAVARQIRNVALAFRQPPSELADGNMVHKWLREETELAEAGRQLVLSRGFGFCDVIFQGEATLLPLAQTVYGAVLTLADLQKRLAHYEGWQGYWLLHLQLAGLE